MQLVTARPAASLPTATGGGLGAWARLLAGLLSAALALSVGHLVASLIAPSASPVLAVGSTFIDLTPEWLKSFAIATFGESDKLVLLGGIGVVLAVAAAGIGLLAGPRPVLALAAIGLLGVVGAAAALSRPLASPLSVVPSLAGGAAGMVGLLVLSRAARSDAPTSPARRAFMVEAGALGAVAIASGGLGVLLGGRRASAASAVTLPAPIDPARALPAGVELGVPGITPFVTPNEAFYRVDTALQVPSIDPAEWRLRIHGLVERETTLTFNELLELPLVERDITLTCVSNTVGGGYAGNARWLGVPLGTVLELAGVKAGADQIVSRSIDGMTIGTPTAVALDGRDALLAVGMNGQPLPPVHGAPVRMVIPGLFGYVSATKWLVELELTTFDAYDPYWVQRGWAREAPILTASRIDTPRPFASLPAGQVMVGGVAWAQGRGVERVEVRVDEGAWQLARLAEAGSIDTWRQWALAWEATSGRHRLEVRATDGRGDTQTADRAEPFPSGATGWHSVVVQVA